MTRTTSYGGLIRLGNVAIIQDLSAEYPKLPPFDPPEEYPEFQGYSTDPSNKVYPMIRSLLHQYGFDKDNFGKSEWNPFRDICIKGGSTIIKPNLVKHFHPDGDSAMLSQIVHGSILRPIIDYVFKAQGPDGRITIGDTPLQKADFGKMMELTGIADMVEALSEKFDTDIELIDFRIEKLAVEAISGTIRKHIQLPGDKRGYIDVDIGDNSELSELERAAKQNYYTLGDHSVNHLSPWTRDIGMPNNMHHPGKHCYAIAASVLDSDTFISISKLKTHKKTGVTLSLKNLIGIVRGKEYIPHHRPGAPPIGDAFPHYPSRPFVYRRMLIKSFTRIVSLVPENSGFYTAFRRFGRMFLKTTTRSSSKPIEFGNWYGNDTLWRTILDLNRIILFVDKKGNLSDTQTRNYLSLVDGIIGQDGQGPMAGKPVPSGTILLGTDPVSVDAASSHLMGFDPQLIPQISKNERESRYRIGSPEFRFLDNSFKDKNYRYLAPSGWRDKLERE